MSLSKTSSSSTPYLDKTFVSYTSSQAASYAAHRGEPYSDRLYEVVAEHHLAGGGVLGTLLDVGCGTGSVTRGFGSHFQHVIGVDPSVEMVRQAIGIGGSTRTGELVKYEVQRAEDLSRIEGLMEGGVDILSAGMAAHWFHMDEFWASAARMVKVGGTVALWTHSSLFAHPSTPNAAEVQKALSTLEDNILGPFEGPPVKLSRNMYENLTMPWDVLQPIVAFPRTSYTRLEWNRSGKLEDGETDFFGGGDDMSLKELGEALGTASMVTEWRKANPDLAGTERDCVKMTIARMVKAMGGNGDGDELRLRAGSATTLLLFRRED